MRYTPSGGRVDVMVEANAGGARLTVADNGPGIAPEERTRVFDRFDRRAGTEPPGSGLGLAIVKAIADAHGATVQLADGRRVSARHDAGIPAADIADQGQRLAAKFDALVGPVLGTPRARELREMISDLENLNDIGSLVRLAAR